VCTELVELAEVAAVEQRVEALDDVLVRGCGHGILPAHL
jgi:hypothetical protein